MYYYFRTTLIYAIGTPKKKKGFTPCSITTYVLGSTSVPLDLLVFRNTNTLPFLYSFPLKFIFICATLTIMSSIRLQMHKPVVDLTYTRTSGFKPLGYFIYYHTCVLYVTFLPISLHVFHELQLVTE